jgi:hypothetical protein
VTVGLPTDYDGEASLALRLSTDSSLAGAELLMQWAALDPAGAYLSGLAFSNALITVLN